MNISLMSQRLLTRIRDKVRNGEVSERGLARELGLSQAHIHRVLKGTGFLSLDSFDLILAAFRASLLDLCTEDELRCHLRSLVSQADARQEMPLACVPLGPGHLWNSAPHPEDRLCIPCSLLAYPDPVVLSRLGPDPEMTYSSQQLDIALVGPAHPPSRDANALYAVDRGFDTVLRRIRRSPDVYYLVSDLHINNPARWEILPRNGNPQPIRGRVLWTAKSISLT